MSDWVTIAVFDQQIDAHIAKGKLEAGDIDCVLGDEHLVQMDWLYSIAVGGIKLQVSPTDAEQALILLNEDLSGDIDHII